MRYVAERRLLFRKKGSESTKELVIKVSEPFVLTGEEVTFPVDGIMCGCHVEVEGLDEPGFDLYGMDSLQAISIASNIEPLIERWSDRYDFFWITGEDYFEKE
jgi:hypothetical protein